MQCVHDIWTKTHQGSLITSLSPLVSFVLPPPGWRWQTILGELVLTLFRGCRMGTETHDMLYLEPAAGKTSLDQHSGAVYNESFLEFLFIYFLFWGQTWLHWLQQHCCKYTCHIQNIWEELVFMGLLYRRSHALTLIPFTDLYFMMWKQETGQLKIQSQPPSWVTLIKKLSKVCLTSNPTHLSLLLTSNLSSSSQQNNMLQGGSHTGSRINEHSHSNAHTQQYSHIAMHSHGNAHTHQYMAMLTHSNTWQWSHTAMQSHSNAPHTAMQSHTLLLRDVLWGTVVSLS